VINTSGLMAEVFKEEGKEDILGIRVYNCLGNVGELNLIRFIEKASEILSTSRSSKFEWIQ